MTGNGPVYHTSLRCSTEQFNDDTRKDNGEASYSLEIRKHLLRISEKRILITEDLNCFGGFDRFDQFVAASSVPCLFLVPGRRLRARRKSLTAELERGERKVNMQSRASIERRRRRRKKDLRWCGRKQLPTLYSKDLLLGQSVAKHAIRSHLQHIRALQTSRCKELNGARKHSMGKVVGMAKEASSQHRVREYPFRSRRQTTLLEAEKQRGEICAKAGC